MASNLVASTVEQGTHTHMSALTRPEANKRWPDRSAVKFDFQIAQFRLGKKSPKLEKISCARTLMCVQVCLFGEWK